jgi:hypothetical protein
MMHLYDDFSKDIAAAISQILEEQNVDARDVDPGSMQ